MRSRKFLGYRRHGHGMKGRRGSGLRGGKGFAGIAKHKRMWMNKYLKNHWGRHGFVSHHPKHYSHTINVQQLEEKLDMFLKQGNATLKNKVWNVDLTGAGYTKLLGKGTVTQKMMVKVGVASQLAMKKIKDAGGAVIADGRK